MAGEMIQQELKRLSKLIENAVNDFETAGQLDIDDSLNDIKSSCNTLIEYIDKMKS